MECKPFKFTTKLTIVGLLGSLWRDDKSVKLWKIPKPCETFSKKYDYVQQQLQEISCMDDLLSGKSNFIYNT